MTPDDRLDGNRAEALLSGCLALARPSVTTPTYLGPCWRSLEEAFTESPLLVAPVLALDLLPLVSGERLRTVALAAPEALRTALRNYEDHVLARLVADRRWTRLIDAVATLPKDVRPVAAGLTAVRVLQRLGLRGGVGPSLAVLRRLAPRSADELLDEGHAALFTPAVAEPLAAGLEALAKAARRSRDLLGDSELFLVENVAALKGLGPRVALTQLAEVAQQLEESLPARLRVAGHEDGEAPTALEEDSAFPVGGFSSLTTSGSLENLVSSELVFMDGPEAPRPDLFDVRFVEGELLYYARDEAVAVRRRRAVILVLDASLLAARLLDGGEAVQRLTWLCGALAALVRKLSQWLDAEALSLEVVFTRAGSDAPLEEEAALLSLVLKPFRERGQLKVATAGTAGDAVREARSRHHGRARVLLFAVKMPSGLEGDALPDAYVELSSPRPVIHWLDGVRPEAGLPKTALEAWTAATRQLLDGVLKPGRSKFPLASPR